MQAAWQNKLQVLSLHFIGLVGADGCFQREKVFALDAVGFRQYLPPAVGQAVRLDWAQANTWVMAA